MEYEIHFGDLTENAQKNLLNACGIKDPADANWDVFPIATIGIETLLNDRAKEIVQDYLNADDSDDMLEQLRSLHTEGEVSDDLYNYIIDNWDDLLEEEE